MSLKPWREVIVPHPDVLNGTFQQSEFAADLTAVRTGKATPEYGDAKAFYERTFITEGMGKLLTQVAQRLNGKGGEPVIQLQTSFGGGKTHTMLAVYHLANRAMCAGRPLRHPGAAGSRRGDGCATGQGRGAGRHRPCPWPSLEARQAGDADAVG